MQKEFVLLLLFLGVCCTPWHGYTQEEQKIQVEESAEVFLEEYSDEFQENFFEGLKQKGIQNYDRAINYLLECKGLQPDNEAVTHELAKLYFLDKNYTESLVYAVDAVLKKPENYWYLYTLIASLNAQGNNLSSVEKDIPMQDMILRENLAKIYYLQENYDEALKLVESLEPAKSVSILEQKIKDAIAVKQKNSTSVSFTTTTMENNTALTTLESYKARIRGLLMMTSGNSTLLQVSEDALENFPAQPYFYYAHGHALLRNAKYKEAIDTIEAGLDYLFDDDALANKMYQELVEAYNSINNSVKANMYLRKIKPGF